MAQKIYGNNRHYYHGRFISGPDGRSCIATLLMVLVPSVLWVAVTGSFFAKRYTLAFSVFGILLTLTSVGLLMATAFSDPGIIPRAKDYTEHYDARTKSYRMKQPPRYYDLVLRGHPFKLKYCTTCNVYRPPRCTHCAVCENCIERFDHHCPWIGNCIGKRNYWLFFSFVTSTGALNAYTFATAVAQVAIVTQEFVEWDGLGGGHGLIQAMRKHPLAAALVIYCAATVWFTVGLCAYHTYLIFTNQTTYEQIKGAYSNRMNPFNRGIAGNCYDILCRPVRPRYFNAYTGRLLWPSAAKGGALAREVKLDTKLKSVDDNTADIYGTNNKAEDCGFAVEGSPVPSPGDKTVEYLR